MLIKPYDLMRYWNVFPETILHVGAHRGEENVHYENLNWGRKGITWIEAQKDLCDDLRETLDPEFHTVINAAVWGTNGVAMELNIASNGESTSLLNFGTHSESYPDVISRETVEVLTSRIDSLILNNSKIDFVNLDIQGAELEALKGMGNLITNVKWIYVEVNKQEVYINCSKVEELDEFLKERGFVRRYTVWQRAVGWGDAIYIKSSEPRIGLKIKGMIFYSYRIFPLFSKLFRLLGAK